MGNGKRRMRQFLYFLKVLLMSLLRALWLKTREKRKMVIKYVVKTFFRDLCNTIDKTEKFLFYLLLYRKSNRRRREFKQAISNSTLKKYISRVQDAAIHLQ